MITQVYFWIFAFLATGCALGVFLSRHPINGAMSLIGTMVSLAGLYSILASPFLATLQILVYAGAIVMLLVFVIMVLNTAKDNSTPGFDLQGIFSVFPALVVGAVIGRLVYDWYAKTSGRTAQELSALPPIRGSVDVVSRVMFGRDSQGWPLLFLGVGLLLLTAIVGAVLLAKRHLETRPSNSVPPSGGH